MCPLCLCFVVIEVSYNNLFQLPILLDTIIRSSINSSFIVIVALSSGHTSLICSYFGQIWLTVTLVLLFIALEFFPV